MVPRTSIHRSWRAAVAFSAMGLGIALHAQLQAPPAVELQIATERAALVEIFGPHTVERADTFFVTPDLAQQYIQLTGYPLPEPWVIIKAIVHGGDPLGYAVVAEEVGKFYPITFLVGVDTDLRVKGVRVLVYRESHGGGVRRIRYLRQYRGKSLSDPIRRHRDIINISGATLSVDALNRGVKKVLFLLNTYTATRP